MSSVTAQSSLSLSPTGGHREGLPSMNQNAGPPPETSSAAPWSRTSSLPSGKDETVWFLLHGLGCPAVAARAYTAEGMQQM